MAHLCDVADGNKPSDCVSPKCMFFFQHSSTHATFIQKNGRSGVSTATPDSDWTGQNNVLWYFCEDQPLSQQNKMLAGNASAICDSHSHIDISTIYVKM